VRAGVTQEQIKQMRFYRHSSIFDAKEKATLFFAEQVTRSATTVCENALEDLREHYTEGQIVELTLVICIANFANRFTDALQITPDLG